MAKIQRIAPCLWFDDQAEDAAKFYTGIFKKSKIAAISRYSKAGYARQGFNSELPAAGVTRRGASPRETAGGGETGGNKGGGTSRRDDGQESESVSRGGNGSSNVDPVSNSNVGGPSAVPSNLTLTVELSSRLSTDVIRELLVV